MISPLEWFRGWRGMHEIVPSQDPVPRAASHARHAVEEWLRSESIATELVAAAALAVNELVTNAIRHACTGFSVRGAFDGHVLRISVTDGDVRLPVLRAPDEDALGGRGMQIVDAIADGWDVKRSEKDGIAGKVVSVWWKVADAVP
jgi:anti-sigma regulatory factor (Ser/Thr protein kinase)